MNLRVLIAAEHASTKFGGEAALPLHYFRVLRQRNIPTWLVVHDRTRSELEAAFPEEKNIFYIQDTVLHRWLCKISTPLPHRLSNFTIGFLMRLLTQFAQRRVIRKLVQAEKISVIHQPIPVSPKEPSLLFNMGAPVVIGPMNGGIDYPNAFKQRQNLSVDLVLSVGRSYARFLNWLLPGKRKAAMLLVANDRTRKALPQGVSQNVMQLVENGVDLRLWETSHKCEKKPEASVTRFIFIGRLIDWKAVDLLLLAFKEAAAQASVSLTIVGDGSERDRLEQLARDLDIFSSDAAAIGKTVFAGWQPQEICAQELQKSDVLVLPSLLECGGAVVLEAMAADIPVIATNWGGPADYLDDTCGILVEPTSKENFIQDFAAAMVRLAQSPQLREAMGTAGQAKVQQLFDWEVKVDQILEVYHSVVLQESGYEAQPSAIAEGICETPAT